MIREHEVFLMDNICGVPRLHSVLEKLNDVRLWLKVSRLSDIVLEDRTTIAPWAMYGPPSRSDLKWPKRGDTLPENLKLWRDTLRNIYSAAQEVSTQ